MCGIVGIFEIDGAPVSKQNVRDMADTLRHRGPDGEGYYVQGPLGLGHRRLAIIDLSALAHQPMLSSDGRYCLTYNGEVYNFQELRLELEALGHSFRSRTDAEVVLYAYAEWGEKALDRLNGMFAFAIWDAAKNELFLARDRYGVKPLYYCFVGQTLLFSSEVKAFYEFPRFQAQVDAEGLVEYLTFQNFFTDRTLYKGVKMFPAGHYWRVSLGSKPGKPQQYWDFSFSNGTLVGDPREYEEELDRLFTQAVYRQLISDVEVGSYLSGGMDSGSITAIAASQIPFLKTFTVGFDLHSASGIELMFDERDTAEQLSYLSKTEHYEMVLKAGDMERILPELAYHLEEPRVGQSYPNYYAARLASKFCKVVLGGTGGDEILGGYPWRYYGAVVNRNFDHYLEKYASVWQRLLDPPELQRLLAPVWSEVKDFDPREVFRGIFPHDVPSDLSPEDYINLSLYFEAKTFLHGLLVVEDKVSMAHSLESRVPFLDNDLVDFSMHLPVQLKLGNLSKVVELKEEHPGPETRKYFDKTRDGKLIFRRVMERYVPEKITGGRKQGFSAPDASWFKGESIEYVRKVLLHGSPIYNYLDRDEADRLVGDHLEGRTNRRLLIWSLLNLDQFFHLYFKQQESPQRVGNL